MLGARLYPIPVWVNKQAWTCQQEKADISYSVNLLYE